MTDCSQKNTPATPSARLTLSNLRARKGKNDPVVMLTAYDALWASLLEEAGAEILLVGDSLGNVILGYSDTRPVTLEQMLHHTAAVVRGARHAMVVGDMPFLSYGVSLAESITNAGRFLKEAGADAVKLEGGVEMADTVAALVRTGIPVMGHIGYTPQTGSLQPGVVRGRDLAAARRLLADALALQEAGAFAIVLECVPALLAAEITNRLNILTFGIGAGAECDGQVLVGHDLLGLFRSFTPKFVRRYASLGDTAAAAVGSFAADVKARRFPGPEHTFDLDPDVLAAIRNDPTDPANPPA